MLRKIAALAGAVLALILLVLGYRWAATGTAPLAGAAIPPWPRETVRTAVAVCGYPFFYRQDGRDEGLFAELLQQAPLAGASWTALTLSEQEAVAAVSAQSVDLAILCVLRGREQGPLAYSQPLLSADVCLFSPQPTKPGALDGLRVAWFGPAGIAELLLRSGAEPVTVSSASDCLRVAALGEVAACAVDRESGIANATRLSLGDRLFVTGDPLGTVDFVLAWRPGNREPPAAAEAWVAGLRAGGVVDALRQKWLGSRVGLAPAASVSPLLPALAATCALALSVAAGLGFRNRALRRNVSSRSAGWADSSRRYLALFDGANDAIFILTPEQGTILEVNQRAAALTGYDRDVLTRMRFHQLLPARHKRLMREWLLDGVDSGRIEEVPLIRADGSVATVEISSRVIASDGRDVRLCIVRNITERKQMQREIKRVTQFAERILENMNNGVITVDGDGLVTSYNKALAPLLGSNGEAVGRPLDDVLTTRGQPLGRLVQAAISGGVTERHNLTLGSSSGTDYSSSLTISLLRDEQVVSGAILVFTDTAQETKAKEEWQRLATLSALGQVSGVLAHDIRNRVSGVHVGVQYLSEKFPPDDPRRQSMDFIRLETDRVVQVIDDILMLIRPGKSDRIPCRIVDTLERVVRAQAPNAQQRRVEVRAEIAPDLPTVSADSVQLERALSNLVKNAVEAMHDGGRVRLIADAVAGERDGKRMTMARVRVSDDGPGIPMAIRTRLFQPFVSEKKGGTGLGLSIAKRIIDEHGGSLEVESREGQGTTFTILLPAMADRGMR